MNFQFFFFIIQWTDIFFWVLRRLFRYKKFEKFRLKSEYYSFFLISTIQIFFNIHSFLFISIEAFEDFDRSVRSLFAQFNLKIIHRTIKLVSVARQRIIEILLFMLSLYFRFPFSFPFYLWWIQNEFSFLKLYAINVDLYTLSTLIIDPKRSPISLSYPKSECNGETVKNYKKNWSPNCEFFHVSHLHWIFFFRKKKNWFCWPN